MLALPLARQVPAIVNDQRECAMAKVEHLMTAGPESGDGSGASCEFLHSARLVLDSIEDKTVYVRSLRYGEETPDEPVIVPLGYEVKAKPGAIAIHLREIDERSAKGFGGYAPIANTVWTWYQFGVHDQRFLHFIFSFARRLDTAHALWAVAIQDRDRANSLVGIEARVGLIGALATAEVAVVALYRAIRMAKSLVERFRPDFSVPDGATSVLEPLKQIRDAFEHIDERAEGTSGQSHNPDPDAWTIFEQPSFFSSGVLTYKNWSLGFDDDVLASLLDCRELIMEVMSNAVPKGA